MRLSSSFADAISRCLPLFHAPECQFPPSVEIENRLAYIAPCHCETEAWRDRSLGKRTDTTRTTRSARPPTKTLWLPSVTKAAATSCIEAAVAESTDRPRTAAKSRYRRFGPSAASHLRGVTGLKSKAFSSDEPPLSSTWAATTQSSADAAYLCLPGGLV